MIYPRLREVQVRFHSSAGDADRGLVSIDVPPQNEVDKYFLIQRPIEEGVDRTPGWLVGLAVRSIGRVEGRRIGEVHTLINRGLVVGRQLEDVVEGLAELRDLAVREAAEPEETPANRLPEVLRQRLTSTTLMPEPIYCLAAAPMERVEVPTLTRAHGVRELLEHPPAVRQAGWNLTKLERAELRAGPRLHIQNGERKFIDLEGRNVHRRRTSKAFGVGRWDFTE